jgi:hypothetical protein
MPKMARVDEIATAISTPDDARVLLGQYLTVLSAAYNLNATYQTGLLGKGVVDEGTTYLDGIRVRAEADYRALPGSGEALDAGTARQIAFDCASIEEASGQTLKIQGKSSAVEDLGDSIVEAGTSIIETAANAVGSVIPWWVWVLALGAGVLIIMQKTKR